MLVNRASHEVNSVYLSPLEWRLFDLLYSQLGTTVPSAKITALLWPATTSPEHLSDNRRHLLKLLRRKLHGSPFTIYSYHSFGLQMTGPQSKGLPNAYLYQNSR